MYGLQPRHPGERDLQGDGNQPFHLFARSPRLLGDDLDDRRSGVRVGFDVDVEKGVTAHPHQRQRQAEDDERLIERPFDEFAYHGK